MIDADHIREAINAAAEASGQPTPLFVYVRHQCCPRCGSVIASRAPSIEVCTCGAAACSVPVALAGDRGWVVCARCEMASYGARSVAFAHLLRTATDYGLRVLLEELRAHEEQRASVVL